MHQPDLFQPTAPVAVRGPVVLTLGVLPRDADVEELHFGSLRMKGGGTTSQITIELAKHDDGRWMWSTRAYTAGGGWGYRVGPKWGCFAPTRGEALRAAAAEMRINLQSRNRELPLDMKALERWLSGLEMGVPHA